jgi:hypothetical protein
MNIEKQLEKMLSEREKRRRQGAEPLTNYWQTSLQVLLLAAAGPDIAHKSGVLFMTEAKDGDDYNFCQDVIRRVDMPPNVGGIIITPSWRKGIVTSILNPDPKITQDPERYILLFSHYRNHKKIVYAAVPSNGAGIDIFEHGRQIADYSYRSTQECIDNLSRVLWRHLCPGNGTTYSRAQIERYTKDWCLKVIEYPYEIIPVHEEFSYVHSPALLGLTPLEATFKMLSTAMIQYWGDIDYAIRVVNELNMDSAKWGKRFVPVTKKDLVQGRPRECDELLNLFVLELEQALELLLDTGIDYPEGTLRTKPYASALKRTCADIYRNVVGRDCPEKLIRAIC